MPPLVTSRCFQRWRQEGTESSLRGKQQPFYGGGCLCLLLTTTLKTLPHLREQPGHPVRAPGFCRLSDLPQVLLSGPDDLNWSILVTKESERSSALQQPQGWVRDVVPPVMQMCDRQQSPKGPGIGLNTHPCLVSPEKEMVLFSLVLKTSTPHLQAQPGGWERQGQGSRNGV